MARARLPLRRIRLADSAHFADGLGRPLRHSAVHGERASRRGAGRRLDVARRGSAREYEAAAALPRDERKDARERPRAGAYKNSERTRRRNSRPGQRPASLRLRRQGANALRRGDKRLRHARALRQKGFRRTARRRDRGPDARIYRPRALHQQPEQRQDGLRYSRRGVAGAARKLR